MTTDSATAEGTTAAVDQNAPITQDEINAVRDQLLKTVNLDELKNKNSAVLTVMMPLPLRVMIDQAALEEAKQTDPTATEGSAADYIRNLIARQLNYTLPVKSEVRKTKDKRSADVQQKAQRAMVAELIERARRGEVDL